MLRGERRRKLRMRCLVCGFAFYPPDRADNQTAAPCPACGADNPYPRRGAGVYETQAIVPAEDKAG